MAASGVFSSGANQDDQLLPFDLFGRIVQYVYNNKNIVRTDIYIYNNKYHMYILSKKPRITQKVVKLISIVVLKKIKQIKVKIKKIKDDRKTVINMNKYCIR